MPRKPPEFPLDLNSNETRTIIDLRERMPGAWQVLGHYHYRKAMPPLIQQLVGRRLVIALMISGFQSYQIGEHDIELRGGQGLRILPGSIHSSAARPEERGELIWLTLAAPRPEREEMSELPGIDAQEQQAWWGRALDSQAPLQFEISNRLVDRLQSFSRCLQGPLGDLPRTELQLLAGRCLVELYRCYERVPKNQISWRISRALEAVEEGLWEENFSGDQLAVIAGISPSQFYRQFRREAGTSPQDWILRRKVEAACGALRQGRSVSWVAIALGFSSSQYFATVFKRFMALNPSEWKNKNG